MKGYLVESLFFILILILVLPTTIELLLLTIGSLLPNKIPASTTSLDGKWILIIPASNEEETIGDLLDNIKKSNGKFDTVLIADNCTDATASIAREKKFRVLERSNDTERGKSYALQFAFDTLLKENYDWFAVLDADTKIEPHFITTLQAYAKKGIPAIQAFHGINKSSTEWRQKLMRIAFYAFNYLRPRGRTRLGFSAGLFGCGFALHRTILQKVPYAPHAIAEDLWYHCELVNTGISVFFIEDTEVLSSCPSKGKAVNTQRARWEGGRLRSVKELLPKTLNGLIKRHWLLIEPLLELLTLPLSYYVVLLLILAFFQPYVSILFLSILAFHVITAILLKGNPSDFITLLSAPFYVIWKLTMVNETLKASKPDAEWIRTERSKKEKRP